MSSEQGVFGTAAAAMQKKHAGLAVVLLGLTVACSGKSETGAVGMPGAGGSASQAGSSNLAGSSSRAGATSVGNDTSLADFPSVYAAAACALYERCWKSFASALNESCESYFERLFSEQSLSNIEAAVNAGTVQYHPEALPACVTEIEQLACDSSQVPQCERLFVGTKQTGDDCNIDQECGADSECVPGAMCPGKCAKRGAVDAVCNSLSHCATTLKCVEPVAADGKCVLPVSAGKACSELLPCGGLLACIGVDTNDPQSTGTCQNRDALYSAGENEACSIAGRSTLCKPGLSCVFDASTASAGTCHAQLKPDASCQLALPEQCPSGQYCAITSAAGVTPRTGQCTKTPGLGEKCSSASVTYTGCQTGQFCDSTSELCTASKHLAETCTQNRECYSDHCGTDGTCVYPLDCEPPT